MWGGRGGGGEQRQGGGRREEGNFNCLAPPHFLINSNRLQTLKKGGELLMAPGFQQRRRRRRGVSGDGMGGGGGRVDLNFLAPRFPTEPNSGPVRKESGAQIPETGPGRCPLVRGVINRPPNYRSLCPLHYTVITPPKLSPPPTPTSPSFLPPSLLLVLVCL